MTLLERTTDDVAMEAVNVAQLIWPALVLTPRAGVEDRQGVDAYLYEKRIQIKGDQGIAKSGNLYIEAYEKTKGKVDQEWRVSPHRCDGYIFVTYGDTYRLTMEAIESLVAMPEFSERQISETSRGYLLPLSALDSVVLTVPFGLWADDGYRFEPCYGCFSTQFQRQAFWRIACSACGDERIDIPSLRKG